MEYLAMIANDLVEFFKIVLTWPAVILIVVIIFRLEISRLIDRLKSIGMGDARADFQQKEQKSNEKDIEQKAKELEQELNNTKSDLQKAKFESDKKTFFALTYRIIYKSQIELLKALVKVDQQGLTWNFIMVGYFPNVLANTPFVNFMNFLKNSGLISWQLINNDSDAIVTITLLGKEFLEYLGQTGYDGSEKFV